MNGDKRNYGTSQRFGNFISGGARKVMKAGVAALLALGLSGCVSDRVEPIPPEPTEITCEWNGVSSAENCEIKKFYLETRDLTISTFNQVTDMVADPAAVDAPIEISQEDGGMMTGAMETELTNGAAMTVDVVRNGYSADSGNDDALTIKVVVTKENANMNNGVAMVLASPNGQRVSQWSDLTKQFENGELNLSSIQNFVRNIDYDSDWSSYIIGAIAYTREDENKDKDFVHITAQASYLDQQREVSAEQWRTMNGRNMPAQGLTLANGYDSAKDAVKFACR